MTITEIGNQPLTGKMLNRLFHDVIAAATGLSNDKVRPAFQFEPPLFDENVNWSAFRSSYIDTSFGHYECAEILNDADRYIVRHEETIRLHASFYGVDAMANAGKFKDCFYVQEYWSMLEQNGIRRISVSDIQSAPDLIDEHWIGHYDVDAEFRRQVDRVYNGIGSISSLAGTLYTENGEIDF